MPGDYVFVWQLGIEVIVVGKQADEESTNMV
jgi:hypothetical protein